MSEENLTKNELHNILHASGLEQSRKLYRSHYCTSQDDPELLNLVKFDYFSGPHYSASLGVNNAMFYLTEKGKKKARELKKILVIKRKPIDWQDFENALDKRAFCKKYYIEVGQMRKIKNYGRVMFEVKRIMKKDIILRPII